MEDAQLDPLFGAAPGEIPLPSAPLVGVIAQVAFTEILSIDQKSFIAAFQERVRKEYPLVQSQTAKTMSVDVSGASIAMKEANIWRFTDATRTWRLSLTPTFLALETRRYSSRADFIERLGRAVDAAKETLKPTHVVRIGVRYIDQVDLENYSMADLLKEEMMGVSGTFSVDRLKHSISEVLCSTAEGSLLARWGALPANASHEPEIMRPIPNRSWFLDLDAFADYAASPIEYDGAAIRSTALALATRVYAFFRWAIKDEFLTAFGAKSK